MEITTNADRFRSMTDEGLAKLLHDFCKNSDRCWTCPLFDKACAGVRASCDEWIAWISNKHKENFLGRHYVK